MQTENAVLREYHGKKRILLCHNQRRQLAARGKVLGHKIIEPGLEVGQADGRVICRERLGGLLKYYHRRGFGTK
ncbi:MAG: hypothetical protein AB7O62_13480 [Pirellulales bacterium]